MSNQANIFITRLEIEKIINYYLMEFIKLILIDIIFKGKQCCPYFLQLLESIFKVKSISSIIFY